MTSTEPNPHKLASVAPKTRSTPCCAQSLRSLIAQPAPSRARVGVIPRRCHVESLALCGSAPLRGNLERFARALACLAHRRHGNGPSGGRTLSVSFSVSISSISGALWWLLECIAVLPALQCLPSHCQHAYNTPVPRPRQTRLPCPCQRVDRYPLLQTLASRWVAHSAKVSSRPSAAETFSISPTARWAVIGPQHCWRCHSLCWRWTTAASIWVSGE